ncbi:hypothetical protein M3Y97_00660200 [Aphelenchoides bicaudatus]|nr:hypothetical protein M3Y97_00660200 [Aphelenchoides bicaudatus]
MSSCASRFLVAVFFVQLVSVLPALSLIDMARKHNSVESVISFAVPVFAPIYTFFICIILDRCERKGGFFMRYGSSYETLLSFFGVVTVLWLGAMFVLYFLAMHLWRICLLLLSCALATVTIPCSLGCQATVYDRQLESIYQENLSAGQALTPEQVQTIYKLNVYHLQARDPHVRTDQYGRDVDGKNKAFKKWMHSMKRAAQEGVDCQQLRDIYNQMAQQCYSFELSNSECQKIKQIAQIDGIVCAATTSRSGRLVNLYDHQTQVIETRQAPWTLDERRRSHSYIDLRRERDAPPSYRASQLSVCGGLARRASEV